MSSTAPVKAVSIVVADPKDISRTALEHFLSADPAMEVVAGAASEEDAIRYLRGHRPDVLLYAVRGDLPESFFQEASEASPETSIVALAPEGDVRGVRELLRLSVSGVVCEDENPEYLMSAVARSANGQPYISPSLAIALANLDDGPGLLTARELEILRLIALGHTNSEIAGKLFLSVRTVESHRASIIDKLDLESRSDLVAYAIEEKLIP